MKEQHIMKDTCNSYLTTQTDRVNYFQVLN